MGLSRISTVGRASTSPILRKQPHISSGFSLAQGAISAYAPLILNGNSTVSAVVETITYSFNSIVQSTPIGTSLTGSSEVVNRGNIAVGGNYIHVLYRRDMSSDMDLVAYSANANGTLTEVARTSFDMAMPSELSSTSRNNASIVYDPVNDKIIVVGLNSNVLPVSPMDYRMISFNGSTYTVNNRTSSSAPSFGGTPFGSRDYYSIQAHWDPIRNRITVGGVYAGSSSYIISFTSDGNSLTLSDYNATAWSPGSGNHLNYFAHPNLVFLPSLGHYLFLFNFSPVRARVCLVAANGSMSWANVSTVVSLSQANINSRVIDVVAHSTLNEFMVSSYDTNPTFGTNSSKTTIFSFDTNGTMTDLGSTTVLTQYHIGPYLSYSPSLNQYWLRMNYGNTEHIQYWNGSAWDYGINTATTTLPSNQNSTGPLVNFKSGMYGFWRIGRPSQSPCYNYIKLDSTGGSNLNNNFIGIAAKSVSNGEFVPYYKNGDTLEVPGIDTANSNYYVTPTGSYSTSTSTGSVLIGYTNALKVLNLGLSLPPPVYYYLGGAIDPATAENPNQNGWTVNTTNSFTLQNSISAVVPGVEDNPVYNTFVGRPVFFQLPWELDIVNTGGLTLEWWQRVPSGSTNVERVTSWMLSQNSPLLKYTQEFDAALGQRIDVITYNNTYPGIIAVNNSSLLGAGNAPIENAWQHFAVTLASNGQTMTLWVNGVLGVQNTFTNATPAAATKFNYLSILNANGTTIENAQNLNRLVSRVRLRTGVRYTSTFTPLENFTPDSNTIFYTQFNQYQAGTVLTNSAVQKVGTNQTVSAYSTPHDFMWKSLRIPSRSATYFCVAYKSSSLIQTRVYEVKDSTPNTVTLVFTGTGLNWGTRSNFDLVAFPGTGQPKTYNSNLVTDGYFVLLFRSNINGLSYTIRLDHLSGVLTITGTTENSFNQYITSTTYLSHRNQLFTVSTQDIDNSNTSLTAHLHDIVLDNTTAKGYTFSQVSSANYTGYSVYLTTGTNYFAFTLSDDRVSDLQVLVYTTTGGSVVANVFYLDPQTDAISRGTSFVNVASIPFGSQPYNQLALSKLGNRVLLAPKTSGTPYNTQTPLRGLTITNNTPTITNDSTNLLYDKNVVGAAWVGSDRVIAFQLAPDVNPNKRVTSLRLFPDTWSTATQLETALPADFTESDVPPVNVERIGNTVYALIMNTSTSFAIYKIELQF